MRQEFVQICNSWYKMFLSESGLRIAEECYLGFLLGPIPDENQN